jgi:hypothetical protein
VIGSYLNDAYNLLLGTMQIDPIGLVRNRGGRSGEARSSTAV